jgi:hypothetical protein
MSNAELRKSILDKTFIRDDCAGWVNRLGVLAADAGMRMEAIAWGGSPLRIVTDMVEQVDSRGPLLALLR